MVEASEQAAQDEAAAPQSGDGEPSVPEHEEEVPRRAAATSSVRQEDLPDAAAHGKAILVPAEAGTSREQQGLQSAPAAESDDDVIEEIKGHPEDGRQHVYMFRQRGDHFVGHEEIPIDVEVSRVELATKRLISEVKDCMKTAHYHKRCFDQIEGIIAENKELTTELERLRKQLEEVQVDRVELDLSRLNTVLQLSQKERERAGLAEEVSCLRWESARLVEECTRLIEEKSHMAQDHLQVREQSMMLAEELRIKDEQLRTRNTKLSKLKVNTKKHLKDGWRERDSFKTQAQVLERERDVWRGWCEKVAQGIMPVLDLISPELPLTEPRVQELGLIEKCQRSLGWLQQFVKDAGEYAGTHALSMVRAHYPLIDFTRFLKGYPKDVDDEAANKLRLELFDLSADITKDVNLYGAAPPPATGAPAISVPSSSTQRLGAAVSTRQSPIADTSSREQPVPAVMTSQTTATPTPVAIRE